MYDVTCCTPRIQRVSTQPVDSASIVRNIASLCLRMQVVFNIPITTIDEIFASLNAVDSVTQMYSFQAVERSLKDCGITSQCVIQSVHDTFCHENIFSRCISQNRTGFAGLLSTHKRRAAFYKCNFPAHTMRPINSYNKDVEAETSSSTGIKRAVLHYTPN
jgi:hypothetical protein